MPPGTGRRSMARTPPISIFCTSPTAPKSPASVTSTSPNIDACAGDAASAISVEGPEDPHPAALPTPRRQATIPNAWRATLEARAAEVVDDARLGPAALDDVLAARDVEADLQVRAHE